MNLKKLLFNSGSQTGKQSFVLAKLRLVHLMDRCSFGLGLMFLFGLAL